MKIRIYEETTAGMCEVTHKVPREMDWPDGTPLPEGAEVVETPSPAVVAEKLAK